MLNEVLKFVCLDFDRIKALHHREVDSFGEKEVKDLCLLYLNKGFFKKKDTNIVTDLNPYEIREVEVLEEYKILKLLPVGKYKSIDNSEIYRRILQNLSFANISKLIQISLVIPLSRVDCERSFSKIKLIKTRLRNSLEGNTLDELMLISLAGDDIETFNFVHPIEA